MTLPNGARIGSYGITGALGAGGMGEVYRARDLKLGRDVALKVLPDSLAGDPDRLARFHREAQVLAALNHPNIAQIYGFEDTGATHALVMELVEGPTLAELIEKGALPLGDALEIARQIANALDAAHEQGIVHRDLKPANIKVRDDGTVKVLDFGLAKALDPAVASSVEAMNSPTLTARDTRLGTVLGTAAYMAPEQAKGKAVDHRADIWAFGVVLFEMLSGQRAFRGEDVSDVLAAVLRQEIDWRALPATTPTGLRRVLARCLERDVKRRLRDIGDVWIDIEAPDGQAEIGAAPAPLTNVGAFMRWLPWVALVAVAAASATWIVTSQPVPELRPVVRSVEALPESAAFLGMSPDGTRLAYSRGGEKGVVSIALRRLDQFGNGIIPGTEGGIFAVFSPDGESMVFSTFGDGKIHRIATSGGTAAILCDGYLSRGAAWGDDNTLVFAGDKGLMRVSADGGTPEPITALDPANGETVHERPQFLPGGRQVLFTVRMSDGPHFAVQELGEATHRILAAGGVNGKYVPSGKFSPNRAERGLGHLIFVRGTSLFAEAFDPARLEVTGSAVSIVDDISVGGQGMADYVVSSTGVLAYVSSPPSQGTTLAWADRAGTTKPLQGQSGREWGTGRVSPDGRTIVNAITNDKHGRDIWTYDAERGTQMRLTFGGPGEVNDDPIWSPNGRLVYYHGISDGKRGLYMVPADASARPSLLLALDDDLAPSSVSPDGARLLFTDRSATKRPQIMVLELGHNAPVQPKPLHDAIADETEAQFSRDGEWVAYVSTESGSEDVYVVPFPGPGAKTRVSLEGGGYSPRWSSDGRELLYWTGPPNFSLMTVDVTTAQGFRAGLPRELFRQMAGTTWDVSPDRNKFLVELTASPGKALALVTNWFEELRRRVPLTAHDRHL